MEGCPGKHKTAIFNEKQIEDEHVPCNARIFWVFAKERAAEGNAFRDKSHFLNAYGAVATVKASETIPAITA